MGFTAGGRSRRAQHPAPQWEDIMSKRNLGLIFCMLAGAPAALADDGTILIGQPVQFPYVISQPGSYRLSSNLTVAANAPVGAIDIAASSVTLDMNGFTISCAGCSAGAPIGILVTGTDVLIRNGQITGFQGMQGLGAGVSIQGTNAHPVEATMSHVSANNNGFGFYSTPGSTMTVMDSAASDDYIAGVAAQGQGIILRCNIIRNVYLSTPGAGGIYVKDGVVSDNLLSNVDAGIVVAGNARVVNNMILGSDDGIRNQSGQWAYGFNFFGAIGFDDVTPGLGLSLNNNIGGTGIGPVRVF